MHVSHFSQFQARNNRRAGSPPAPPLMVLDIASGMKSGG